MTLSVTEAVGIKKVFGLIGIQKPYALFLQTRWGIHTFGVRFPIDIVILDDTHHVITHKKHLKPNRIFLWNPKFKNILELPAGTIDKERITQDKKIDLQFR